MHISMQFYRHIRVIRSNLSRIYDNYKIIYLMTGLSKFSLRLEGKVRL